MTDKEIRDEAVRTVMARLNTTNNAINRYIADAVINATLADEAVEERELT